MTWNRLRWALLAIGLGMTLLGAFPLLLLLLAFQSGPGGAVLLFIAALLLSPLLLLLRLGPAVVGAVWRGQQVMVMGRQWSQAGGAAETSGHGSGQPRRDPDVIDGEFENERP